MLDANTWRLDQVGIVAKNSPVDGSTRSLSRARSPLLQSRREEGLTVSTITIELPDDEDLAREMRLSAAIHWYSLGLISQGRGAEIAGMDRRSFILALGRAGVDAIQVGPEELKAEVELELGARRQRLADHLPDR